MKLILFGANGATGRLLTRAALDAGHSAVAVTRRPDDFPFTDPQLTIAHADVRDQVAVAELINGADAVLSTLSVPFTRHHVDTFSVGTANITAAMHQHGVRRLVVTSSTGADRYPGRRNAPVLFRLSEPITKNTIGKTVYDDTRKMEDIVRTSGLDWTIVRPSILFDLAEPTNYIAGEVEPVGALTARIDLAHYLLTVTDDETTYGKTVIISTIDNAPTFWQAMRQQSFKPAQP